MNNLQPNSALRVAVISILLVLWFGFSISANAVGVGCDDAYVQLDNQKAVITVAPNNNNDTTNIQCALDAASSMGVPIVKLAASKYYISLLIIENFKGTLEGKTKTSTILEVLDDSINCSLMASDGFTPSAIKFIGGEPRIRYMTIRAYQSCTDSNQLSSILHFTGEFAYAGNCDNDVIFGAVDRVVLDGIDADSGPIVAVRVTPEGDWIGGCKDTLLGTFKLNRSLITNTHTGIYTGMRASAQVDINFNEFRVKNAAIALIDTNQITTITSNDIFGGSTLDDAYIGIAIYTDSSDAPNKTRVVIDNNDLNVSSSSGEMSMAIGAMQTGRIANVSSIVTNNRFNLSGLDTWGVFFVEVSNVHVSANNFSGYGDGAVYVSGNRGTPASGWTITANTGLSTFSSDFGWDIVLGPTTTQCIVGPGQGASVVDTGLGNEILSTPPKQPTLNSSLKNNDPQPQSNLHDLNSKVIQHLEGLKEQVNSLR